MDFDTLKSHSVRLHTLEQAVKNNYDKTLSEVQSLRREVNIALQAMQKAHPDTPDPHPMRSDSPAIFQPLTPAPRAPRNGIRRARSSVLLGKVGSSFQSRVFLTLIY
jgi:hypothetical protein